MMRSPRADVRNPLLSLPVVEQLAHADKRSWSYPATDEPQTSSKRGLNSLRKFASRIKKH
jgi:hypothetical protein